jgi:radical SAM protein with 4Fe4S-binding SPASM domain
MSLHHAKKVIAEVSAMLKDWSEAYDVAFTPSFNITGGEPLLRGDLFDILSEIKRNNFGIFLLTNGTLIDQTRTRMLADLGVTGVQVSIEGAEEVHDAIRGEGSFAASAAGIEHLVDVGIPVTLNVTLSNLNAGQIKKVIAFGSHIGADKVGFSRLVPYGRGRSLLSQTLEPEQVKDLYESLWSLELSSLKLVTGDPLASQMKLKANGDEGSTAVSGCAAGVSGLTILPNGNVTPCRRLPLSLGNVRRHSLRRIWATSPILEALRDRSRYKGKCGTCRRWAHCRGCRAIAYAFSSSRGTADFLADDPQCFLDT